MRSLAAWTFFALLVSSFSSGLFAQTATFNHDDWTKILSEYVSEGSVFYAGLKEDPTALNQYLDDVAQVPKEMFDTWSENDKIAFLVNLYNAATIRLILDYYPIQSIKRIGGIFQGPWDQKVVRLFGKLTTLDFIEHKLLRKLYKEPRIHFALVCAAKGCPPLRNEAYVGDQLHAQLNDQGRIFIAQSPQKNRVNEETKTLYLSPIFKWFKKDFLAGGEKSLKHYVIRFLPKSLLEELAIHDYEVKYTNYDWSLNETET